MNNLWNQLKQANLTTGDLPIETSDDKPWYLRIVQGFAGWVASLLMLGFFVMIFSNFIVKPTNLQLMIVGIICSVVAYFIFKNKKSDFLDQFALSLSLAGQIMFAFALFENIFHISTTKMFVLGAYQLCLAIILPHYVHRLITSSFALLVLFTALFELGLAGLSAGLLAFLVSGIWLYDYKWGKRAALLEPMAYALVIGLVYIQVYILTNHYYLHLNNQLNYQWLLENSTLISSLLVSFVFIHLVWVTLKEHKISLISKEGLLALVFCLMLIAISFKISGLSTGLLIVFLGFIRNRITLTAIGIFSVISFFSWYYYNLDLTLLVKSLLLMGLGLTLILGYIVFSFVYKSNKLGKIKFIKLSQFEFSKWLGLATVMVLLIAINLNIVKKEDLITHGNKLLFRLGPVDPRSIMQGDYMRLRFDLAMILEKELRNLNENNTLVKLNGQAIVETDENKVVNYVALYDNQKLKEYQYLIPYKSDGYRITIVTAAYYFQEGKRSHYQKARYGEFHYKDGEMLLVNLVDKAFMVL